MPSTTFSSGFTELRPRAAIRENHNKQQTTNDNYLSHRLFLTADQTAVQITLYPAVEDIKPTGASIFSLSHHIIAIRNCKVNSKRHLIIFFRYPAGISTLPTKPLFCSYWLIAMVIRYLRFTKRAEKLSTRITVSSLVHVDFSDYIGPSEGKFNRLD